MNLSEQCVSLDLAKRLKELGVKQESLFYWSLYGYDPDYRLTFSDSNIETGMNDIVNHGCGCCSDSEEIKDKYSAFTCAELGEILPKSINSDYIYLTFNTDIDKNLWEVFYGSDSHDGIIYEINTIEDKLITNALAKMLIHLLEQGLIKNDNL